MRMNFSRLSTSAFAPVRLDRLSTIEVPRLVQVIGLSDFGRAR